MASRQDAATHVLMDLVRRVSRGEISPQRALFAWMQAGHESVWGVGYGPKNQDVYNYGSIGGEGPAGHFTHGDSSPGKGVELRKFKKFHNAQEGLDFFVKFTDSPSLNAAMGNASLVQGCCALYERGYYENSQPDTSDENAAKNIIDYAAALSRQLKWYPNAQPLGAPEAIFKDVKVTYAREDAKRAWHSLFAPGPMRRRPQPRAALRAQSDAGVPPKEMTGSAAPPVLTAAPLQEQRGKVFRLRKTTTVPAPGVMRTTRLANGSFTPWEKT